MLHVLGVAEHIRQVEHVEIVYHRAERADGNASERDGADLRLFDRFLFAAELHRRIHGDRETALGGVRQFLAEALDRGDGRIAGRMHVGGFEHQFLLRNGGAGRKGSRGSDEAGGDHGGIGLHGDSFLPGFVIAATIKALAARLIDPGGRACYSSCHMMTLPTSAVSSI